MTAIKSLLTLLLAAVIGLLWYRGQAANAAAEQETAEARMQALQAERDALVAVLDVERVRAHQLNEIADRYERERDDAQQHADKLAADLRAGAIRLRQRWQAPACPAGDMPATAASASEFDAAAADRAESAARIVRAAAECDAQVRGLQAVIRADRGE